MRKEKELHPSHDKTQTRSDSPRLQPKRDGLNQRTRSVLTAKTTRGLSTDFPFDFVSSPTKTVGVVNLAPPVVVVLAPPVSVVDLVPPVSVVDLVPPVCVVDLVPPVCVVDLAPPVSVVDLVPPVCVLNLTPPVCVVDLAPPIGVLNLTPPVCVLNLTPPVGVVDLVSLQLVWQTFMAPPVNVVNLALIFAKPQKRGFLWRHHAFLFCAVHKHAGNKPLTTDTQ